MKTVPIQKVFGPLYGQPCWNVQSGYGTFLTLEFGPPVLSIQEPEQLPMLIKPRRIVTVCGEWHLWIVACSWEVWTDKKRIGHSNHNGSSKLPIQRAAKELDGQKLVHVSFDPNRVQTTFQFDLGSPLETRPYDPENSQWLLYEPSGNVFALQNNGRHGYRSGNTLAG